MITIIGGLSASFKWIYEYSKKLEWEKNKFMLDELEKFNSLENTKLVEKMLDWNKASFTYSKSIVHFDDDILIEALMTHNLKSSFTNDEVIIRKMFDEYFDNLTKLIFMSKVDLINQENLKIFLNYWFKILSGKSENKKEKFYKTIDNYLSYYGFSTLKQFLDENYEHG